jgi:hypothetical protein
MANIIALHLGMSRRTGIKTILDSLAKNANPSLAFVLEQRPWIENLKAYGDECVHYRSLTAHMGYEVVRHNGLTTEASMPYVIPERISPVEDRPDTRARRAFEFVFDDEQLPEGLSKFETRGSVRAQDGTILASDHSIGYEPAPGYIRAEEFCSRHLYDLREFIGRAFDDIPKLGFALQRRTPTKSPNA